MSNYQSAIWAEIYDSYNQGRHEQELKYYLKKSKEINGKILEIACGTGMIFLPILNENVDIYGFDISLEMIEKLKEKSNNNSEILSRITVQNMIDFNYQCKFDLIFIPARSFLHITDQDDQIKCLINIKNHLNAGGRLILNFFNPSLKHLFDKSIDTDEYKFFKELNISEDKTVKVSFNQINDLLNQIQKIKWKFEYDKKEIIEGMHVKWIYREEFKLLLKLSGFLKWNLFGDFDENCFTVSSNEMIWEVFN